MCSDLRMMLAMQSDVGLMVHLFYLPASKPKLIEDPYPMFIIQPFTDYLCFLSLRIQLIPCLYTTKTLHHTWAAYPGAAS